MKLNKKLIEDQIKCAKALTSQAAILGCLSTIERECKKFGVDYPTNWNDNEADINIDITSLGKLHVSIANNKVDYNAIMANKHTYIANTETIDCNYRIIQVLVGYNCHIHIRFNFSCPLPEEDLITLRNLGKVETEYNNYSSMSENVICKI